MSNRTDEVFEALLKVAAKEVIERKVAALPSCEELNRLYKPSPAFEKRVHKIINKHVSAKRIRRLAKTFWRVAAVFCVFITVSTAVLMSAEASRIFILNTIIGFHEDHAVFEFVDGSGAVMTEGFHGNIPYGFELLNHQVTNGSTVAVFISHEGSRLFFTQNEAEAVTFAVDTEYTEVRMVVIDGQEVYLFLTIDDYGLTSLTWRVENTVFMLMSDVSVDELFDIAEVFLGK